MLKGSTTTASTYSSPQFEMEHVRDPQVWDTLRELKKEGKIKVGAPRLARQSDGSTKQSSCASAARRWNH